MALTRPIASLSARIRSAPYVKPTGRALGTLRTMQANRPLIPLRRRMNAIQGQFKPALAGATKATQAKFDRRSIARAGGALQGVMNGRRYAPTVRALSALIRR